MTGPTHQSCCMYALLSHISITLSKQICLVLDHLNLQTFFSSSCVVTLHLQVVYIHSPSICLVYTLQADVKFQQLIFGGGISFCMYTFYFSLSNQFFVLHYPNCCLVYTLSADVRFQHLRFFHGISFFNAPTLKTDFSCHFPSRW